jgi:hypothetical protein
MKRLLVFGLMLGMGSVAFAGSSEKAKTFYDHRLPAEAKKEAIDVVFDKASSKTEKAICLDLLARIDVDENDFKSAFDTWTKLVKEYPDSPEAKKVDGKLKGIQEVVNKVSDGVVSDSIAKAYLFNARFWSSDRSTTFKIDTSFLSKGEAASYWYDLVIKDFAGTDAARIAYEDKIRTIQSWDSTYAVTGAPESSAQKLNAMEKTFRELETAFPTAGTLQAFRYQIAQEYWKAKDWMNTKKWLQEIIDKSGSESTFYKDMAQRRLKKVEY